MHACVTGPSARQFNGADAIRDEGAVMDAEAQAELNDLQFHWSERYFIAYDEASGLWSARYKTGSDVLTALTPEELRDVIRIDYPLQRQAEQAAYARLVERSSI
jgi:hypothetical protein